MVIVPDKRVNGYDVLFYILARFALKSFPACSLTPIRTLVRFSKNGLPALPGRKCQKDGISLRGKLCR
jgi:hypothetical protein